MQLVTSYDTEIISMLTNRDKKAMVIIIEKYGDQLYSFVFQQLGSELLASEALKKTLSQVWTNSSDYDKNPDFFFIWVLMQAGEISREMQSAQIKFS